MKSQKIEFVRFDDLNTGILIEGKPYLISYGNSSAFEQVLTPQNQGALIKELSDEFRYAQELSAPGYDVVDKMSKMLASSLIQIDELDDDTNHVELFLNPSELGLIPFELLLDENKKPKFIVDEEGKGLILTRNIRQRRMRKEKDIPKQPRVLFVHTKPGKVQFKDHPHHAHWHALSYALRHFNEDTQLESLANPTFQEFKASVLDAIKEENPFTHIHILAHGDLLLDVHNPADFEYGIAFNCKEEPYQPTSNKEIRNLFEEMSDEHLPYLVNYMICDGANFTNGLRPDKNPVQVTFKAGVPIVIGSQFPLSMKGSTLITEILYERLLLGEDIRIILGDIRTQLHKKLPNVHDWVSLVSYVDLPEDYELQLLLYRGNSQLAMLNSICEENSNSETKDDFITTRYDIETSIRVLKNNLEDIEEDHATEVYFLENSGLIASAYKRLAEVEFTKSKVLSDDTINSQIEALTKAMHWYKKAADKNNSHHWSLVQYLSLKTVLTGELEESDLDYWYAARLAAQSEINANKNEIWSYGSLIELYLLSPQKNKEKVHEYVNSFLAHCNQKEDKEAYLKSTRLQLERYLNWWNTESFKLPNNLLVSDQDFVSDIIKKLH